MKLPNRKMSSQSEASIFILCGAKGVGKKSLIRRLKRHLPNQYVIFPLHTSQTPKSDITRGEFYHVHHTRREMLKLVDHDEFISHWVAEGEFFGVSRNLIKSYLQHSKACFFAVDGVDAVIRLRESPISKLFSCHFVHVSTPPDDPRPTVRRKLLRFSSREGEIPVERLLAEMRGISRVFDESPELFDAKFTVNDETLNSCYDKLLNYVNGLTTPPKVDYDVTKRGELMKGVFEFFRFS